MGWAKDNISEAERRRIIEELFQAAGARITRNAGSEIHGHCPLPGHEDKNPSFGFNVEKDVFNCSCARTGDLVDMYCMIHNLDQQAGFVAFRDKYAPAQKPASTAPRTPNRAAPPKQAALPEPIPESHWEYLPPLPDTWVAKQASTRGWTAEAVRKLGLRLYVNTGDDRRPKTDPIGRVAIPIRDEAGRLRNIRLYLPGADRFKIFSYSRKDPGAEKINYGTIQMWPPVTDWEPGILWVVEGEPDCICAHSKGLNAATKTGGATSSLTPFLEYFRGRDVVFCYDADKTGVNGAIKNAQEIASVAKLVRIINWPDFMLGENKSLPDKHGQDLTDFFVRHGKNVADLRALLAQATVVEAPPELNILEFPERFFISGGKGRPTFKPALLTREIIKDLETVTDNETGNTYRWNGEYYNRISVAAIRQIALQKLGLEATTARATDAASQVVDISLLPDGQKMNPELEKLCLKNGVFNLKTGDVLSFQQEYLQTYQMGVSFDPNNPSPCPQWHDFMAKTVQIPEVIEELQEFFGYSLLRTNQYRKVLLLFGPGSDGKSTCLNVLRHLVGTENTSAVSWADLDDQFHRASLVDKFLNLDTDVGGSDVLSSQYLKKISGDDPINAAQKHQPVFEFKPWCKLAFSCNSLPKVPDRSEGFYDRLLIIKFRKQFLGHDRDPEIFDKLLAELSGIFAWAWAGLVRLLDRGHFATSPTTKKILIEYMFQNNPVLAFIEERCTTGLIDGAPPEETKQAVYDSYRQYCKDLGFRPLNAVHFSRSVSAALPDANPNARRSVVTSSGTKQVRIWRGIGLVND